MFYAYICLGSLVVPARVVLGHPSPKRGPQLKYSINGFKLTVLTIAILVLFGGLVPALHGLQLFRISRVVDEFWPLLATVNIAALLVSSLLYVKGRVGRSWFGEWVDGHSHGSFASDFWHGREINPCFHEFNIKFVAYRMGMLWWLVLNAGFLARSVETGKLSGRMGCYQLATSFYILDYFWNE
jgi:hypothetical protein